MNFLGTQHARLRTGTQPGSPNAVEASKLVEDGDEDPEFETRSNAVMIGMTE